MLGIGAFYYIELAPPYSPAHYKEAVDAAVRKIEETQGPGAADTARRAMTEALKAREVAGSQEHGEDK